MTQVLFHGGSSPHLMCSQVRELLEGISAGTAAKYPKTLSVFFGNAT